MTDRARPWAWSAIVFALVWPTAYTIVYFLAVGDLPPVVGQLAFAFGKTIQFAFPAAWFLLYEKRRSPLLVDARPVQRRRSAIAGLGFGSFVGAAMVGGYFLWLKPLGVFEVPAQMVNEKLADFQITTAGRYLLLGVFYSLIHSWLEEYYWRWFVFRRLSRQLAHRPSGLSVAIAVSSLGFMAHHVIPLGKYFNLPAALFFTLSVGVGGAVWAWIYNRYQSLLGPWLSHLLVDAAIFLIGYDLVRASLGS